MKNFESELAVKDLFAEVLFRIPDYQRGYSWDEEQLDDIWEDLDNLHQANEHYTGLITVTDFENQEAKWTGFKSQYVIDGQQRLTTLVILLKTLIDRALKIGMKELDTRPIRDVVQKYLYKENVNTPSLKVSILGYASDDPSYDYLKSKILEIKEHPTEGVQTAYTKRLRYAKKYFEEKVKSYNERNINELFQIITNKLVFNLYNVSGDKEVAMIFESMNNRGKKLSVLELLKNRLMYLSEKLQVKDESKTELREKVKKAWKVIYEWLGKNELLDDDEFLRAHWIMYYNYDRTKSKAFADDLLNNIFSIKKAYSNENSLTYEDISKYAVSLSEAVKHWYYMNFPDKATGQYDKEIIYELLRLNRIGYTAFKPLIMAILLGQQEKTDFDLTAKILRKCEDYVFKVFALSDMQSNTGDSHFYRRAKMYFDGKLTKQEILSDIDEKINSYFRIQNFKDLIDKKFEDDGDGYYDWNYLNYFLFEYDLYLKETTRGQEGKSIDWAKYTEYKKDYLSIEHIYPQKDDKECWKKIFGKYNKKNRNALKNTLGNLLPLSTQRNSAFQNNCFQEKKDDKRGGGYCVGSFSEAEVNKIKEWNVVSIKNRGIRMLEFMEKRWNISIDDKLVLLHLKNIQ